MTKKMIGGQALRELGSTRYTDDVDYMIFDASNPDLFIHNADGDVVNAANDKFYSTLWTSEVAMDSFSLTAHLNMAIYTFAMHCRNMMFEKVITKEHDIKFLVMLLKGKTDLTMVKPFLFAGEITEIEKMMKEVRF